MMMIRRAFASFRTGRQRFEPYLLLVPVILLAMALYLYGLDSKSLWFDELATLTCAGWKGSWADAIRKPLTIPTTPKPPLSFVITHLFLMLGDRVFILRLPSALFAVMTIPLVYVLGKSLFDKQVGLFGAFLLTVAPLHVRYAQEARMYAMLAFFSTLSLYLFWQAIRARRWCWWLAFAVVTIFNLYTHLFALLPLGVMGLFALWFLVRSRSRRRFSFRSWHLFGALAAILLLLIPLAPFLVEGLAGEEGLGGVPTPGWDLASLLSALRLFSGGSSLGLVAYASLFVVAAVTLALRQSDLLALTAMWIVLPVAAILGMPFGHTVQIRYFVFALPVYLLLVAYGLQTTIHWLTSRFVRHRLFGNPRPVVMALATVALLGVLGGISGPSIASYYAEDKQNWRDATWLVHTLAKPGDKVFVRHVYHRMGVLFYAGQWEQDPKVLTEASVQILPNDLAAAFPPADEQGRWLVVPYREDLLPGGEFDARLQPHYHLLSPTVLRPSNVPRDAQLLGPTSFRTLAVIQVVPAQPPAIRFWADDYTIATGTCTWLRWDVENVREVYLANDGVVGRDKREVCPTVTTNYELTVIHLDGSVTLETIEIVVFAP